MKTMARNFSKLLALLLIVPPSFAAAQTSSRPVTMEFVVSSKPDSVNRSYSFSFSGLSSVKLEKGGCFQIVVFNDNGEIWPQDARTIRKNTRDAEIVVYKKSIYPMDVFLVAGNQHLCGLIKESIDSRGRKSIDPQYWDDVEDARVSGMCRLGSFNASTPVGMTKNGPCTDGL